MNIINLIKDIGLSGFLDIGFMGLLIYTVIVGVKRTRAAFVLTGIFILSFVYLLTRLFNLAMTASVFESFFTIILVVLVVIFQEELKHFFEEIAIWSLNRRLMGKKKINLSRGEVETLVRTTMDLAREKIGALIVIRGKNVITRHLDGGVSLKGDLSEPLLKSIFDPHSVGHDGAVIIDGNRITDFSCHLPLSKNLSKIKDRGTRHAAGLGLSEVSDVFCLIVSEEKGTISVARNGDIQVMNDPEKLTQCLQSFYEEISPERQSKPWEEFFKRNTREKIYALLLAVGLWFVLVHGSKVVYKSFIVPVSIVELPEEWVVAEQDPKEIKVTFRGARTAFYFQIKDRISIYPDIKIQKGSQQVKVTTDDFTFPKGLILADIDPSYVKVMLDKKNKEE